MQCSNIYYTCNKFIDRASEILNKFFFRNKRFDRNLSNFKILFQKSRQIHNFGLFTDVRVISFLELHKFILKAPHIRM